LADTLPRENPAQGKTIELIMHSGHRLARLVEDILAFTKIRNDALDIKPTPTHVAPIVEEVVTTCHPLIGQRPVRLVTRMEDNLPPVMADSDRLYQVLFNLLGNAIKFTDEGAITLSVEQTGDALRFTVEDEGIGIPQEELSRMMKPYEQGQNSSLDGHGGVGLGLAISRQILLGHGSDLTLESARKGGVIASFSLPVSSEPANAPSSWTPKA
ncbi:HAMP domain-containing sensor histidine kinase, partial [Marinospirillum sp.]|uniref:sensor histidine kinase n=1 Tax=Marinospirillum sp. TaxID=2183934 RepID=UPI0028701A93